MESRCIKVKLKANTIEEVREWFSQLNRRKLEVLETLKNEKIYIEAAYLDIINDSEFYLIYYIKAKNIEYAMAVFKKSILPIDQYYKKNWQKYCGETIVLEGLLDIDLLSEK